MRQHIGASALFGLALCLPNLMAQNAKDSLDRLATCGVMVHSAARSLRLGLVDRIWVRSEDQRKLPLPPEYLKNLAAIADACEQHTATQESIVRDLQLKDRDCQEFGMGRTIAVRIETLKGSTPVTLWEVFYQWMSGRGIEGAELRIPGETPVTVDLPVGIYSFQARKSGVISSRLTIPVAGSDSIKVQITVP
jgi:hypothetical protein